jgi:hypothetical protein
MLNWLYPNSLHVYAEIWRAQRAGELPSPDAAQGSPDQRAPDLIAFEQAAHALKTLGDRFGSAASDVTSERFSLVLVESVLWTQFEFSGADQRVDIDASGPAKDDLVLVTGEPVLYAMESNTLTLSSAVETGLLKLYGDQARIEHFLSVFGDVGG